VRCEDDLLVGDKIDWHGGLLSHMIFKKTPNIIEELKKASSEKRMNTIKGWLDPVASDFHVWNLGTMGIVRAKVSLTGLTL